jgi:hypothetical protein
MGEDKLKALLQESLAVATRTDAMKPSDLARVVIDTTVQPKAVMFPTDAKVLNRARERLVRLTKKLGVSLRQSYARVGKLGLIKHQRHINASASLLTNKAGEANYRESSKSPAHANVDPQVRSDRTAQSGAGTRKPVALLVKVDDWEEGVE